MSFVIHRGLAGDGQIEALYRALQWWHSGGLFVCVLSHPTGVGNKRWMAQDQTLRGGYREFEWEAHRD